jgi:hypothetical protein
MNRLILNLHERANLGLFSKRATLEDGGSGAAVFTTRLLTTQASSQLSDEFDDDVHNAAPTNHPRPQPYYYQDGVWLKP